MCVKRENLSAVIQAVTFSKQDSDELKRKYLSHGLLGCDAI